MRLHILRCITLRPLCAQTKRLQELPYLSRRKKQTIVYHLPHDKFDSTYRQVLPWDIDVKEGCIELTTILQNELEIRTRIQIYVNLCKPR